VSPAVGAGDDDVALVQLASVAGDFVAGEWWIWFAAAVDDVDAAAGEIVNLAEKFFAAVAGSVAVAVAEPFPCSVAELHPLFASYLQQW